MLPEGHLQRSPRAVAVGQQQIWQGPRKRKMEKVSLSGSLPRSSIHGRRWIEDRIAWILRAVAMANIRASPHQLKFLGSI